MTSSGLNLPTVGQVAAARDNIRPSALRTPLVKLNADLPGASIFLKLENLQPWGSFKIRPALNALKSLDHKRLSRGVLSASSGNFGRRDRKRTARPLDMRDCLRHPAAAIEA